MSRRTQKRRRTGTSVAFGAPSADDLPFTQQNIPSSSALSTRTTLATIPALTTLCARVFVANARNLADEPEGAVWKRTSRWLKILPDPIVPKIFAMLRASCPTILNDAFITTFFLRGQSITLSQDLPGVKSKTISAITRMGKGLHELVLEDFSKHSDTLFASLFSSLPSLRILVLRGCTQVAAKTVEAAAKCKHLTTINLNQTSAPPVSVASLLIACTKLEVLKLAGISNWTDATFSKLRDVIVKRGDIRLPNLRNLKLRQVAISDNSVKFLISLCPNLKRLDLSFTHIRKLLPLPNVPPLEKLSLTSTRMANADLLAVVSLFPSLKILSLAALGGGQGSSAAIGNSSSMTMTDETLDGLTKILKNFQHLESVSLVGNTKLGGKRYDALSNFIYLVGRKCKKLNVAGLPCLRTSDLAGLIADTAADCSPLETLILNNTSVDDEAAPYISSCLRLQSLEVAGTTMTSAGLFPVIDACSKLERLDLTSCRGINVVHRRHFFEVWERDK